MLLGLILLLASVVTAADGVPIHYEVKGKGEPALVFIHCWSCDRTLWENQVAVFAKNHRVVTIDLPGHGESGKGRTNWSIESYGEDVKRVVTKLGLKRVVLIGSSMGGPVALEAARRMPERVVAIVPVDTLQNVDQRMTTEQVEGMVKQIQSDYKGRNNEVCKPVSLCSGHPSRCQRAGPLPSHSNASRAWDTDSKGSLAVQSHSNPTNDQGTDPGNQLRSVSHRPGGAPQVCAAVRRCDHEGRWALSHARGSGALQRTFGGNIARFGKD